MTWFALAMLAGFFSLCAVVACYLALAVAEGWAAGQAGGGWVTFDRIIHMITTTATIIGITSFTMALVLVFAAPGARAW